MAVTCRSSTNKRMRIELRLWGFGFQQQNLPHCQSVAFINYRLATSWHTHIHTYIHTYMKIIRHNKRAQFVGSNACYCDSSGAPHNTAIIIVLTPVRPTPISNPPSTFSHPPTIQHHPIHTKHAFQKVHGQTGGMGNVSESVKACNRYGVPGFHLHLHIPSPGIMLLFVRRTGRTKD